jgi:hypothetical protein
LQVAAEEAVLTPLFTLARRAQWQCTQEDQGEKVAEEVVEEFTLLRLQGIDPMEVLEQLTPVEVVVAGLVATGKMETLIILLAVTAAQA